MVRIHQIHSSSRCSSRSSSNVVGGRGGSNSSLSKPMITRISNGKTNKWKSSLCSVSVAENVVIDQRKNRK
jgi:hypothetical protein